MKGLIETAEASKKIRQREPRTWLGIFYDLSTDTVNTSGKGWKVCELIRENSPQEIEEAVRCFLRA